MAEQILYEPFCTYSVCLVRSDQYVYVDSLTLNRSLNSLSLNRRLRRKRLEKRVNFETRMEVLGEEMWTTGAILLSLYACVYMYVYISGSS